MKTKRKSEFEEEIEDEVTQKKPSRQIEARIDCPYLDTINRQVLDFDFEKFCSVSLSNLNIYACLVCGKYYQGKGPKSHAYNHSLESDHHVYINLQTEKVYCLPDGYEVIDSSLDDIRYVLNPKFSSDQMLQLDETKQWSRGLEGCDYLPGMVGLNNIKETGFMNVVIQSLMRVTPLRDFFLVKENYQSRKSALVHRFGELTRKIWNARNFKGHVSPHEFIQAVVKASEKRFGIGEQSDPVEFMLWFLNTLHADLRASKKSDSIIHQCFQGELEVAKEIHKAENNVVLETSRMPFLLLGLDLPPPLLTEYVIERKISEYDVKETKTAGRIKKIMTTTPQVVPLFDIMKKFDGESLTGVKRYRVTRLPRYMILHIHRFSKNKFCVEKNPTLVKFPVKNLELKDYIPLPSPEGNDELRSKYNLIANVVHDGNFGEGSYRAFVQRKSEEIWYEMQDLHVVETDSMMVENSEAYIQIYEQKQ